MDAFPAFFTGAAWTCAASAGASCPASGCGDSLSEPVDLPPGGSVTYTVTGTVALDATVVLSNTAEVALPADVSLQVHQTRLLITAGPEGAAQLLKHPALVVASALNPSRWRKRAEPASHGLGMTKHPDS